MSECLVFDELDYLLGTPQLPSQNEVKSIAPTSCQSSQNRRRLAERIADTDELVRQLKDLQRTAGEVTKLYQHEKQQRMEFERRANEQSEALAELEKQLVAQNLNVVQLQDQLKANKLPVDAEELITTFIQLTQRHAQDTLSRKELNMMRKLNNYCKSEKISIPTVKSPPKRSKAAPQHTQTTQTDAFKELQVKKPQTCSIAVQSENLVTTRNQGTQHKNMTTTRGTTTASFIKKHDVGTNFPEPEPKSVLSAQQILEKMLEWNITPLSPILSLPEGITTDRGTCTDLCNVLRTIDYLPILPKSVKQSDSRPPSRGNVKDELGSLGEIGHHMATELLHLLPQSQSILTQLPTHVFEEVWREMGQVLLVLSQRRSTHPTLPPPPPMPALTTHQAEFRSWCDALYESTMNQAQNNSNEDAEHEVTLEEATSSDMGTDPMMPPPPEIGLKLTPIRLLAKPKARIILKPKLKAKPKKKIRRVILNLRAKKKKKTIASTSELPTETAVQFLSNLNIFKTPNCDILDIQLDEEERQLLELASASENKKQVPSQTSPLIVYDENSDDEQVPPLDKEEYTTQNSPISLSCKNKCEDLSQSSTSSFESDDEAASSLKNGDGCVEEDFPQSPTCSFESDDEASSPLRNGDGCPEDELESDDEAHISSPFKNKDGCSKEKLLQSSPTSSVESDENNPSPFKDEKVPVKSTILSRKIKLLFDSEVNSDDEESSPLIDAESHFKSLIRNGEQSDNVSLSSHTSNESDEEEFPSIDSPKNRSTILSICALDIEENLPFTNASKSAYQRNLFSSDDEEYLTLKVDPPHSSPTSSFETDDEKRSSPFEEQNVPLENTAINLSCKDQVKLMHEPKDDKKDSSESRPSFDTNVKSNDEQSQSDEDSMDSSCLVIDDVNLESDAIKDNETEQVPIVEADSVLLEPVPIAVAESILLEQVPSANKRKRKSSSVSSCEQPAEKRLTRSQAKKLTLSNENLAETTIDKVVAKELEPNYDSPMSPEPVTCCEESEPIIIPLDQIEGNLSSVEPKALLSYICNKVKAEAKQQQIKEKQLPNHAQLNHLKQLLVNYLRNSAPLDYLCIQFIIKEETAANDVLIAIYNDLEDNALQLFITLLQEIEGMNRKFIERFMNNLDQRLFFVKERLNSKLAQKYVRLYLQLINLQEALTNLNPGQKYDNPARLLLVKILYFYSTDMSLLVLQLLSHYPTVLPHREQRDYDHSDAIITVIKHLLMSHKYDMTDVQGSDRTLLSKLRFEYHYQPFEPTKQQVIENLVEKLNAGRLQHLSYAFTLLCRRSPGPTVTSLLDSRLLPLVNTYCDLCSQTEEYDERLDCLLQCISMIVKQMRLDNTIDISNYIAIFRKVLVAVPRPVVQQAAVQAILRTQRFGFNFALDALNSYRPSYELNPMTRAMIRTFAERRRQYQGSYKKVARGEKTR